MSFIDFAVIYTFITIIPISVIIFVPVILLTAKLIELFFRFLILSCKRIKVGVSKHE